LKPCYLDRFYESPEDFDNLSVLPADDNSSIEVFLCPSRRRVFLTSFAALFRDSQVKNWDYGIHSNMSVMKSCKHLAVLPVSDIPGDLFKLVQKMNPNTSIMARSIDIYGINEMPHTHKETTDVVLCELHRLVDPDKFFTDPKHAVIVECIDGVIYSYSGVDDDDVTIRVDVWFPSSATPYNYSYQGGDIITLKGDIISCYISTPGKPSGSENGYTLTSFHVMLLNSRYTDDETSNADISRNACKFYRKHIIRSLQFRDDITLKFASGPIKIPRTLKMSEHVNPSSIMEDEVMVMNGIKLTALKVFNIGETDRFQIIKVRGVFPTREIIEFDVHTQASAK